MRRVVHPGEIIREEFMLPLKMSLETLAAYLDLPYHKVKQIVIERDSVDSEMVVSLASAFGTSEQFWFNLQNNYNKSSEQK